MSERGRKKTRHWLPIIIAQAALISVAGPAQARQTTECEKCHADRSFLAGKGGSAEQDASLPGWIFNVATIVHGIEAVLAAGIIFTIHFFNANLRPEKFPIDVVMFTGRATTSYMKEEHPLQYERLVREGRLDDLIAPAPSRWAYLLSVSLGLIGLVIGLQLVALMIWALLQGVAGP